jgi:uncharacterized protein YndB with AHSA1/START domain
MTTDLFNRREFAALAATYASGLRIFGAAAASEITHDSDAIHDEVAFNASRQRVYELLTDAKKFDRVIHLSDAMKGGMPPNAAATSIGHSAGEAFTLFAGMIGGRHIELVPNERIVQAWRPAHWKPGIYSIVRFQLSDQGTGTKLVFDHTGFPKGEAPSLNDGWHKNYWQPMEKALA